jgi:hypothetical protein
MLLRLVRIADSHLCTLSFNECNMVVHIGTIVVKRILSKNIKHIFMWKIETVRKVGMTELPPKIWTGGKGALDPTFP